MSSKYLMPRRRFLGGALKGATCLSLVGGLAPLLPAGTRRSKYNVLFISVDDLRPALGCYGNTIVKSPNIDQLAARGLLFERAYCQQAVCNPSRASLLTGRRPDTTRVYDLQTHFRDTLPATARTLPEHFKRHGYHTQALGKIYHDGLEDPASWSVPKYPERNAGMQYVDVEKLEQMRKARGGNLAGVHIPTLVWQKRESWQVFDAPDNAVQDGQVADRAIETLRGLRGQRFFLAVGFLKPHLPFVAPRKYFDLYPPQSVPPGRNQLTPQDVPPVALHPWTELRGYTDIPDEGPLPEGKALELVHAYYAATSYMDAQVGRVLDELDHREVRNETIVALWGDHGFHLGEHNLWGKTSNFELDARAPFILSVPGQNSEGKRTRALVEFVDIYPTLNELCGLPVPAGLEGTSVTPLLSNPSRRWKRAAFTQFPRPNPTKGAGQVMGRTIRTDRYRYTEWAEAGKEPIAIELYDYREDPNETVNIAARTESKAIVAELRKELLRGWRGALPPK